MDVLSTFGAKSSSEILVEFTFSSCDGCSVLVVVSDSLSSHVGEGLFSIVAVYGAVLHMRNVGFSELWLEACLLCRQAASESISGAPVSLSGPSL